MAISDPRPRRDRPPRAVVGVGESRGGVSALAWALDLCRSRGWHLDVVTAWPDLGEPFVRDVPGHYSVPRGRATGFLAAALEACGVQRESATTHAFVVNADPVDALVDRSRGAELLVVGASGDGRSHRAGHPAVGESCRERAQCAVVVVDEDGMPSRLRDRHRSRPQAIVTAGSR